MSNRGGGRGSEAAAGFCGEGTPIMLAAVESGGDVLQVRRSNSPYVADIRGAASLWCWSLVFFSVVALANEALIWVQRQVGDSPVLVFTRPVDVLIMETLLAVILLVSLMPIFVGLRAPQTFTLDAGRNTFLVEGQTVGTLDHVRVVMQDNFGPSRRAFRIVARVLGQEYVVAHTQRLTTATLYQKEYPGVTTQESRQRRYWFNRWADYQGEKTGFDPAWPEYRDIFSLYKQLTDCVEKAKAAGDSTAALTPHL